MTQRHDNSVGNLLDIKSNAYISGICVQYVRKH